MPGATAPGAQMAGLGTGGVSGMGAVTGGYQAAQQNLMNSLNASNNTTSSQQMQLGQQLQQNQGNVQQMMTNRGLGNTTIAGTMSQVPLNTYNMGMAQVQNQGALRQMAAYNNLAQLQAQGGQAVSQMQQPYAQQNAVNQQVAASQPGPSSDFNKSNAQNQMLQQYQNLMQAQQPLSGQMSQWNGQGFTGAPQATTPLDQSQAMQAQLMGLTGDASADFGG